MTPPTHKRDPRPALPVIFRMEGKGADATPIAFFPTEPDTATTMTCYSHVGQHSGASFGFYHMTRNAKPEDYAALLAELRGIYETGDDPVRLVVYRRFTARLREEFNRAARRN
jgi:hypothetical protein